jgi:hypothetical protein
LLTFKAQDKDWQYDGKTVTAADQAQADPAQSLLARRTLARGVPDLQPLRRGCEIRP